MKKSLIIENQVTNYDITDEGKIYNHETGYELKGSFYNSGYQFVNLSLTTGKQSFLVHRLVAMMFLPNPDNLPVVNHIDGNKNNNRVSNLEWISYSKNTQHAQDTGLLRQSKDKRLKVNIPEDILIQCWRQYRDTNYYLSYQGRVYNKKTKIVLKATPNKEGYDRYSIRINGKTVNLLGHRMMIEAWLYQQPSSVQVVNHIDGNKANNVLDNLEIISKAENVQHACYTLGKTVKPVIRWNKDSVVEYPSLTVAAKENQVAIGSLSSAIKYKSLTRQGYYWKFK